MYKSLPKAHSEGSVILIWASARGGEFTGHLLEKGGFPYTLHLFHLNDGTEMNPKVKATHRSDHLSSYSHLEISKERTSVRWGQPQMLASHSSCDTRDQRSLLMHFCSAWPHSKQSQWLHSLVKVKRNFKLIKGETSFERMQQTWTVKSQSPSMLLEEVQTEKCHQQQLFGSGGVNLSYILFPITLAIFFKNL